MAGYVSVPARDYARISAAGNAVAQTVGNGAIAKINAFDTNGQARGATPDQANDKITINRTGVYRVSFCSSFSAVNAGVRWTGTLYVNGVATDAVFDEDIATGNTIQDVAFQSFVQITGGQDIDVRVQHDFAGARDATFRDVSLDAEGPI